MFSDSANEDFGVVLKGRSITRLPKIAGRFNDCFIVNNFDRFTADQATEWDFVSPHLRGKKVVHFVNRLNDCPLLEEHYHELGITDVQFSIAEIDSKLSESKKIYESYGLRCHLLPRHLLSENEFFRDKYYLKPGDSDYTKKHPNTGVLAIVYALKVLKPRNLWIGGLDFYQVDYLVRRSHLTSLENQQLRVKNTKMLEYFCDLLDQFKKTNFYIVSDAKLPKFPNLVVL